MNAHELMIAMLGGVVGASWTLFAVLVQDGMLTRRMARTYLKSLRVI